MKISSSTLAMIGMCLATFLGWLDITIINTALPAMQNTFNVDDRTLQWVMNALLLALSAFMVIVGNLADRYGRRRLLYFGMLLLVLSSIGAALSESFMSLIVSRFFQGIAIGILYTTPIALISSVTPQQVPRAMGIMIGTGGFALALGPVAGGLLVSTFGWHSIFWINLPITLLALLFCLAGRLPEAKAPSAQKIDLLGALLMVIALPLLIFTTVNVHDAHLMTTLISYAIVIGLGLLFVYHENRTPAPIIDFHLFANRAFIIGVIANFFLAFFYCVDLFYIPLHLEQQGYHSSMTIGLMLLPPSLMFAVLSLFSGRIAGALGAKKTMLFGYVGFIVSAALQIILGHSAHLGLLLIPYLFLGMGWALILATSFSTALASLPQEMAGLGMGSIGTLHNLGGTVGLALGATLGYFGAMGLILATSLLALVIIVLGFKKS
jgi:EmrB/QacA subfamily drug resistance transporter